jgi:hypothetical protein
MLVSAAFWYLALWIDPLIDNLEPFLPKHSWIRQPLITLLSGAGWCT